MKALLKTKYSPGKMFTLLAMVLLFCGKSMAQSPRPMPSNIDGFVQSQEEKKAILEKREQWRKTFEAKSVEDIMGYYAPDILSYDLMAPIQFEGEAMWRNNWVNFFNTFNDIELTFEDLTVFQSGDLATIRCLTRLQCSTADGGKIDMWSRETNVIRKINCEWLSVHDHVSVPIDFVTGQALTDLKPIHKK